MAVGVIVSTSAPEMNPERSTPKVYVVPLADILSGVLLPSKAEPLLKLKLKSAVVSNPVYVSPDCVNTGSLNTTSTLLELEL